MLSKYFEIHLNITSGEVGGYEHFIRQVKEPININNLKFSRFTKLLTKQKFIRKLVFFRLIWPDTDLVFPRILFKLLKENYDVVDVLENYSYSSFQAVLAKPLVDTKVAVMNWENIVMPAWRFSLRILVNKRADAFRVPSISAKRKLISEGVDEAKISYIPPCVDVDVFRPEKSNVKEMRGLSDNQVILFVGRLVRQKGLEYLIKSLPQIIKTVPKAMLVVVGDGPFKAELIRLSQELGVTKHVRFLGTYPYDRIQEVYQMADVVVLPSIPTKVWSEQFGYVLIEAMACGKAVVGTRIGAIPEIIIDDVNGYLVPPYSSDSLALSISKLLLDPDKAKDMGKRGREMVIKKFSSSVVKGILSQFYKDLVY
ncbi:MAG: glycosyltransferase family 4 protein [archaeon]|nr:glycosyltransferase family 4 protein [archaeon]